MSAPPPHNTASMSSSSRVPWTDESNTLDNITSTSPCDWLGEAFFYALDAWIMVHQLLGVVTDLKEKAVWKAAAVVLLGLATLVSVGSQGALFACSAVRSGGGWFLAFATLFEFVAVGRAVAAWRKAWNDEREEREKKAKEKKERKAREKAEKERKKEQKKRKRAQRASDIELGAMPAPPAQSHASGRRSGDARQRGSRSSGGK